VTGRLRLAAPFLLDGKATFSDGDSNGFQFKA
jgi:hypothetical protein